MNNENIIDYWDPVDITKEKIKQYKIDYQRNEIDYLQSASFYEEIKDGLENNPSLSLQELLEEENLEQKYDDYMFNWILEDCCLWEQEWEFLIDNLQYHLEKTTNDFWFYVESSNMGWRRRSGYKMFRAKDAEELISRILPDCDCSFTIYNKDDHWVIRNSHHDAPTGETYKVFFIETFEKKFKKELKEEIESLQNEDPKGLNDHLEKWFFDCDFRDNTKEELIEIFIEDMVSENIMLLNEEYEHIDNLPTLDVYDL